jgi:hypothetical protein
VAAARASKPDEAVKSTAQEGTANITQLFNNDKNILDLGDTQLFLITIIAIVIYTFKSFNFLSSIELAPTVTLPDIETFLLSSFGIGQGAYLATKAASNLVEV